MEKAIENYLNSYRLVHSDLTDDDLAIVRKNLSIQRFKKKQIYIQEGEVQRTIGYIHSGLIRSYFIDQNGKEISNAFFAENEFVTDYLAFIQQQRTKYIFECLEDSVLFSIPYETVINAYENSKNFANFGRKIMERALETRTSKYESFLNENAEERYLKFLNENKPIINRISLTHLSSYLGIERQSLSRIRSKIVSQK